MPGFWLVMNSFVLMVVGLSSLYLWLVALAGVKPIKRSKEARILSRFAIAIAAYNEESVIGATVANLRKLEYPVNSYDIFVVADNCSDSTAEIARREGATCLERFTTERSGKGAALRWLFERIFEYSDYDAIVVFDADTKVSANFLQVMNNRLSSGTQVVQGRHVISNPHRGWFPALAWALMTIDCRLFSQGRTNLGLSARHMGDSICFRSNVIRDLGWGGGLTEDYEFRLKLLLDGICIFYEPNAKGYGQAALTWAEAHSQRLRWARGVADASQEFRCRLLTEESSAGIGV